MTNCFSLLLTLVVTIEILAASNAQKNTNGDRNRNSGNSREGDASIEMEDVRFNKFYFTSSTINPLGFKPLKKEDYPISGLTNSTLRLSDAYSVITLDDYEVVYNVPRLIREIGGLPPYPDSNESSEFWNFREVIDVQKIRRSNPNDNTLFPRPERWTGADLNEVAEFVHNEMPGTLQMDLLADILAEKFGPVNIDLGIVPYRSNSMFLRKDFMLPLLSGWAMSIVGPHNFAAKWYAGRARPEELAWLIYRGKLRNVPSDVERNIRQMNLRKAADFTAYDEGSPRHPSWPAMHAASASLSFWLSIVLNLNEEQLCEARLTDYAISYARTVAGVHYPDDNIAGLNLAQEVLSRALPQFLKDKYNSNPFLVAKKIRQNRFDWRNFDPQKPC